MNHCPVCGSERMVEVVRPEEFRYEGLSVTVPDYRSMECQNCGEAFATEDSVKRAEPLICDLHRQAEGMLTSQEIRQIRESLGFSQDDFGVLLGGGKKAFARYENGRVTQARAMDNLLRVLKAYPQALCELRSENSPEETSSRPSTYQVTSMVRIGKATKTEYVFPPSSMPVNLITGAAA